MKKWWRFWIIPIAVVGVAALLGRLSHVPDRDLSDTSRFKDYKVTYCMESADGASIEQDKKEFINSDYIAVVKCIGVPETMFSGTRQKVEILQVLQGESSLEGQEMSYIAVGAKISARLECFYGTFVNLMREGEYYLAAMDEIADGYLKDALRCPSHCSICWLPLSSFQLELPPDSELVKYHDVADLDGFVRDEEGIRLLREYRKELLEQYLSGTEWWSKVQELD